MFAIELGAPIFIFLGDLLDASLTIRHRFFGVPSRRSFGRRSRQAAFVFLMLLQLLITATGNFGFFNLLAMLLCVPLLDDGIIPKRLPGSLRFPSPFAGKGVSQIPSTPGRAGRPGSGTIWLRLHEAVRKRLAAMMSWFPQKTPLARSGSASNPDWFLHVRLIRDILLALPIVFLTTMTGMLEVADPRMLPKPLLTAVEWAQPFRSANGYGLFRVMTQERLEIIIEGSDDGTRWKPYEFKYKPGDLYRRPGFCTPYMPRLDWQMWFYVLQPDYEDHWFIPLLMRILAGDQHVLALLGENPFPDHPPKFIRALEYTYTFAPVSAEGRWWSRSNPRLFVRPVTLEEVRQALAGF